MLHYAAFHLGLHSLQKYSFRGFPLQNIFGPRIISILFDTLIVLGFPVAKYFWAQNNIQTVWHTDSVPERIF